LIALTNFLFFEIWLLILKNLLELILLVIFSNFGERLSLIGYSYYISAIWQGLGSVPGGADKLKVLIKAVKFEQ
jgi:hypothetical protein